MNVEEICKLLCKAFSGPRFCKAEILIVSELAKIFANDVLEVIKHSSDGLNFVAANFLICGGRYRSWVRCKLTFSREFLGFFYDFFWLLVFNLNNLQLVFKFIFKLIWNSSQTFAEPVQRDFFSLNPIFIFAQLTFEVQSVLHTFLAYYLVHLTEYRLKLFIQSLFVKGKVLVIQNQTLIFFLNFLEKAFAKIFNFFMEVRDLLCLAHLTFLWLLAGRLQSSDKIFRSNLLAHWISTNYGLVQVSLSLICVRIAFLTPLFIIILKQHHASWVHLALLSEGCLRHQLSCLKVPEAWLLHYIRHWGHTKHHLVSLTRCERLGHHASQWLAGASVERVCLLFVLVSHIKIIINQAVVTFVACSSSRFFLNSLFLFVMASIKLFIIQVVSW